MAKVGEIFLCHICGNKAQIIEEGGAPELYCCGQPMEKVDK
jgi:desulfoferrodoxin-like iron-binding protein